MPGRILYRERQEVAEGDQMPRFNLVAVADANLKILVTHIRKSELKHIAEVVGADACGNHNSKVRDVHELPRENTRSHCAVGVRALLGVTRRS